MSTRTRHRTVGSTHAEPTHDREDLSAAEREASLAWAHTVEYEAPSIRGVRETAYGTLCLIADAGQCRGLVVVDGLDILTGIEGPEAALLFRELPKGPPPWA